MWAGLVLSERHRQREGERGRERKAVREQQTAAHMSPEPGSLLVWD